MDNIKQKNTIVSRETKPIYYNPIDDIVIRKHIDSDGNPVLICTNFVCGNYSPFESTCISECTWCDNPYHCKYKNVSRETITTAHDIILYMISSDYCWNNFDCNSYCDVNCKHELSSTMLAIAIVMVCGGEY